MSTCCLIGGLAALCRDRLLDEKWLLAPALRIGHQWLEAVRRAGQPVVNVHVKTMRSMALDLAAPEMTARKLQLLSGRAGPMLVDRVFRRLRAEGLAYLGALRATAGLAELVHRSIQAIRMAGLDANQLPPNRFEVGAKGQDIQCILQEYLRELGEHSLVDYAEVLRIAARQVQADPGLSPDLVVFPEDLHLGNLEQHVLDCLPENRKLCLPVDRLTAGGQVPHRDPGGNHLHAQGRGGTAGPLPATINLEALLACKPAQRAKWLQDHADPHDDDREVVDLLFFPTGGGKTEAYLGLAAFALVLRRLRDPGIGSAGLAVLMRYTLRLLTLDQLGRAATLMCALELERQNDVEKLGEWPFEIGLWVGKAATPNRMGYKGDNDRDSARAKTIAFKNDDRKPSPIPLEECPWCGTKFKSNSFQLLPNPDQPTDLRVMCVNRRCDFSRGRPLPILAIDEPIYRRLPCFMIATVDKFAAMPWTGHVGTFFGRVERYDSEGFYGPCEPTKGHPLPGDRLPPPDLIVQDELHLISGPLGTMVGLYETALDELCSRDLDGRKVRPKIVASTATVRRADNQIRALFNHRLVDIFPPPGPDRRDSFFARTHSTQESNARLYLGIAAQGRSPKVVMLRAYLALLAAAQKAYKLAEKAKSDPNPADPYMSLLGYFNSLRELGGARRLIEDEVRNRVAGYGSRRRIGETGGLFYSRNIEFEPVELTSRVSTDRVADAKRRLSLPFSDKDRVDVAIATNMISVGLDIVRLGLMVVFGQPKTSAEYIQATSRVGRDHERPGLVVTILNIHRPRDRSHYERFAAYHESFYRSVEVTSVTPFSPRALDRGLAGTLIALARQGLGPMTPARGAGEILTQRPQLDFAVDCLSQRAYDHNGNIPTQEAKRLSERVRLRSVDLLDEWSKIAAELKQAGVALQYQVEVGGAQRLLYDFLNQELKTLPPRHLKSGRLRQNG